jgi:hypothetical protein
MRRLDIHRRRGGKQAAIRAYGPYVVSRVDKDGVHATIVSEQAQNDDEGIRVRIDELIPIKDRVCTPIYSSLDMVPKGAVSPLA